MGVELIRCILHIARPLCTIFELISMLAASLETQTLAPEPEMDAQLVTRSRIRKILDGRLGLPPDQTRRLYTSSITITHSTRDSTELRSGNQQTVSLRPDDPDEGPESNPAELASDQQRFEGLSLASNWDSQV
jgi:hypothetical protein